ncbi:hypothetical protein Dsin_012934 [Dipteronia sinensis]|uniref:Uncharacterized protein n=1 Tax=Dipteronia sinensis TaxID=43782 RepID=A0AAE0E8M7_9ROSI|nr:hypothetical protein Dsin_012934 [Dipteronia sinensis]
MSRDVEAAHRATESIQRTDLEVNPLHDSLNNIRTATSRLEIASSALQYLSNRPIGSQMLANFIKIKRQEAEPNEARTKPQPTAIKLQIYQSQITNRKE